MMTRYGGAPYHGNITIARPVARSTTKRSTQFLSVLNTAIESVTGLQAMERGTRANAARSSTPQRLLGPPSPMVTARVIGHHAYVVTGTQPAALVIGSFAIIFACRRSARRRRRIRS